MEQVRFSLQSLREEAYSAWETTHFLRSAHVYAPFGWDTDEATAQRLPYTNEYFKNEVRKQFGDLRRRRTWEKAAIYYAALCIGSDYASEAYQILCSVVIPGYWGEDPFMEHYRTDVIEQLLQIPHFLEVIKIGLEQIYRKDELVKERQQIEQFRHQLPAVA